MKFTPSTMIIQEKQPQSDLANLAESGQEQSNLEVDEIFFLTSISLTPVSRMNYLQRIQILYSTRALTLEAHVPRNSGLHPSPPIFSHLYSRINLFEAVM